MVDALVPAQIPSWGQGTPSPPPSSSVSGDGLLTGVPSFREMLIRAIVFAPPPSHSLGLTELGSKVWPTLDLLETKSELQSSPWDEAQTGLQLRPQSC